MRILVGFSGAIALMMSASVGAATISSAFIEKLGLSDARQGTYVYFYPKGDRSERELRETTRQSMYLALRTQDRSDQMAYVYLPADEGQPAAVRSGFCAQAVAAGGQMAYPCKLLVQTRMVGTFDREQLPESILKMVPEARRYQVVTGILGGGMMPWAGISLQPKHSMYYKRANSKYRYPDHPSFERPELVTRQGIYQIGE